jgi:hypothetical protein
VVCGIGAAALTQGQHQTGPVTDGGCIPNLIMEPEKLDKIIRATFAVLIFAAYWYGWLLPSVAKAAQP